jgi:hypothetical protein
MKIFFMNVKWWSLRKCLMSKQKLVSHICLKDDVQMNCINLMLLIEDAYYYQVATVCSGASKCRNCPADSISYSFGT